METRYTVIRADGVETEHSIDWPAEPDLRTMKALIEPILNGGLEHVTVLHEGKRTDLFVDEYGVDRRLPRNEKATRIYRNNTLTHAPGTNPESLPFIRGTAVLFHRRIWF